MAEIEYGRGPERVAPTVATGGSFGRVVNIAGAVFSVGLVIGVGIWGYQLLARDVSGVPVVRALEGPMRVLPEDPGGTQADHQGLAVNAVAAGGAAAPAADRMILAPRPISLTGEDVPVAGAIPATSAASVAQAPASDPRTSPPTDDDTVAALVERLSAGAAAHGEDPAAEVAAIQPETLVRPSPLPDAGAATASAVPVVARSGPTRSLRPRGRPVSADLTGAAPGATAPDATGLARDGLDVDPETLAVGTRLAQLGAFDSADQARREWDRLAIRFVDYLDDKKRVIQRASSGGRTFYRLRAMGFRDLSDARRFCAVLVAENADCIPVTVR